MPWVYCIEVNFCQPSLTIFPTLISILSLLLMISFTHLTSCSTLFLSIPLSFTPFLPPYQPPFLLHSLPPSFTPSPSDLQFCLHTIIIIIYTHHTSLPPLPHTTSTTSFYLILTTTRISYTINSLTIYEFACSSQSLEHE